MKQYTWHGKSYKVNFEKLTITQEGLDILEEMKTRLLDSDKETRSLFSKIYSDKYDKKEKNIIWEIHKLRNWFSVNERNVENFKYFFSQQTRLYKRGIYYLIKEIFKK